MTKIQKSSLITLGILSLFLVSTSKAFASPAKNENKAENNPQVVSYYEDATHTVIQPDGEILYDQPGTDLVMAAGESDNFQQWFESDSGDKVHTLWMNVGDSTECQEGWTFVENPYSPSSGDTWGYHFPDGDNYCTKSN